MQKSCLDDNCYNLTKQLAKKLEFLHHVNHYIEDSHKCGNEESETAWQTIRTDEERHTDMLRTLLIAELKK